MPPEWARLLQTIRQDHRSGASALLGRAIEAGRLFLLATRTLPPERLAPLLVRFTRLLTASQPSMAPFLNLANALWCAAGDPARGVAWSRIHDALVAHAGEIDQALHGTIRHGARLVRSGSLVLTYSHSTAVRMVLLRALAAGRRFEVVCSESRPTREGLVLAKQLADAGIPVHLVVDAALPEWVEKAELVLVGADAVVREGIVNKIGTRPLLCASRRSRIPAFALADSHKWLPPQLQAFWCVRDESPRGITTLPHRNLHVHNRYFDVTPHKLFSGVVWEGGISPPHEARQMTARLPVAATLLSVLRRRSK